MNLIAAVSKNKVIGKNGQLPWHIPKDLANFRELTRGSIVIMGRNTYKSLPANKLPGRLKIVLSSRDDLISTQQETYFVKNKEEALELANKLDKNIFIIGGTKVYKEFIEDCSTAYITYIDRDFEGDAFFPEFSICQWKKTKSKTLYNYDIVNHNNNFEYRMEKWEKTEGTEACN